MKRVLVTGAAGFIGSSLVDALLARGDKVWGVDNFDSFYDPAIKRANLAGAISNGDFTLEKVDIRDEPALHEVFRQAQPEVVVHLAARAGVRPSLEDPHLYHDVNINGSQHILDLCHEFAPSHLVFASSSSVYGGIDETPFREDMNIDRPVSPYAATKCMNELMAHVHHHVYGLNVSMMRFFTVYGPRQRPEMAINQFTRKIAAGEPITMFGDGTSRRDYTYIDDILDGLVKAVDIPFGYEIFNLGESRTTELKSLIEQISDLLGKSAKIETQPFQKADMVVTYADITKARDLLGYDPQTPIEDGLKKFVEWYRLLK
jgi:UDP-glucuronate 4-epimerase